MSKVIDSHLHIWASSSETKDYPYATDQHPPQSLADESSAEMLIKKMLEAKVDGALIVQPINHRFDHRYVANAIKNYPEKFKGMLLHDPSLQTEDAVARLEELVLAGFVGVRFNPYLWPSDSTDEKGRCMSSGSGLAVYDRCGELNVPVGIMCFKGLDLHYDDIVRLAESSPNTQMILDHVGFTSLSEKGNAQFDQLLSLAKYDNIVVKISAIFRVAGGCSFPYDQVKKERFEPLLEKFGKDRLMFGTDFPFVLEQEGGYKGTVDLVKAWAPNANVRDALTHGTAERLFGVW